MYCHKCGSSIHAQAQSCSHCGTEVDHHANMEAFEICHVLTAKKESIRSYSKKIKSSLAVNFLVWLSLALPAILLPFVLKTIPDRYRSPDYAAAYVVLCLILLSIFYFVKKGFTIKNIHH